MNLQHNLVMVAIGLMLAGLLVNLALATWWLWSGYWVALSVVDAIGLISPSTAALVTDTLGDSEVLYLVLAEAPLYGLLLIVGAVMLATGMWNRRAMAE